MEKVTNKLVKCVYNLRGYRYKAMVKREAKTQRGAKSVALQIIIIKRKSATNEYMNRIHAPSDPSAFILCLLYNFITHLSALHTPILVHKVPIQLFFKQLLN